MNIRHIVLSITTAGLFTNVTVQAMETALENSQLQKQQISCTIKSKRGLSDSFALEIPMLSSFPENFAANAQTAISAVKQDLVNKGYSIDENSTFTCNIDCHYNDEEFRGAEKVCESYFVIVTNVTTKQEAILSDFVEATSKEVTKEEEVTPDYDAIAQQGEILRIIARQMSEEKKYTCYDGHHYFGTRELSFAIEPSFSEGATARNKEAAIESAKDYLLKNSYQITDETTFKVTTQITYQYSFDARNNETKRIARPAQFFINAYNAPKTLMGKLATQQALRDFCQIVFCLAAGSTVAAINYLGYNAYMTSK